MKMKNSGWLCLLVVMVLTILTGSAASYPAVESKGPLPYRFLLVISDQWQDPASYLIEGRNEFQILVTLLKTWGLPFDILRLDQEILDRYHLFDREGRPRYGTIIWDAPPLNGEKKEIGLLHSLVREYAVNLVILSDALAWPELSILAGIEYVSAYRLGYGLTIRGDHFITRELIGREKEYAKTIDNYSAGSKVLLRDATVLVQRGHLPFLTIRTRDAEGRVVWCDIDRSKAQLQLQLMHDLLKRCLVWANGYALYAEYPKSILLFMDDFGTSDRTYLPYWHYRTLNETDIRENIMNPLRQHQARLTLNIVSGYVDRTSQRIVNPWQQKVVDELDDKTFHDYVSAKKGLDAGLTEGLFEIQSHGYTHMLPDLESPPGPFWTAAMDGAGTLGFDYEFGDPVRNKEVPAITQKYLLARGLEYIQQDFGVRPLFVINGGSAWSRSYPNHSPRIAAEMGFGLCHFNTPGYLGRDLVITSMEPVVLRGSWQYDQKLTAADVPWTVDAPYFLVFHDRDVSMDSSSLERLLTNLGKGIRYLSADEYCAYLHTQVTQTGGDGSTNSLLIHYDEHYCRYFANHESRWTLHLSDSMRQALKTAVPEKQIISIQPGLGNHSVPLHSPGK